MQYLDSLLKKIEKIDLENKIDLKEVEKAFVFARDAHE
jgi:hypothetical protein